MGPKGGFSLAKEPSKISLLEVIEAIQGPIRLNRCLLGTGICSREKACPVAATLAKLQDYIYNYLSGVTLDELSRSECAKEMKMRENLIGERNAR